MNPFSKIYNGLSSADLIRIIDNPGDYQPLAVEAAKAELASRQLPDHEIMELRIDIKNALENKAAKKKSYEDKLQETISAAVNIVNPIAYQNPSTGKIILVTSVVFGLISAWQIFNEFSLIKFMLFHTRTNELFELLIYLILLIVPLIGAVLLWRRKKLGWLLLTGFIIYSALGDILLLPEVLKHRDPIPVVDSLFPTVSLASVFLTLLFHGAFVYILLKKDIRSIYNIDRRALIQMGIIAVILTAMMKIL